MGRLGFRHPQFSEDLAWLPVWLHQHQCEESVEPRKESTCELASKDLAFLQGNIGEEKYGGLLSREEGRYNSCHLSLSGEDNSPISFASPPGSVIHLNLYLSSDGDLQDHQSQLTSQAQYDSNKYLSVQQVEVSAGAADKNYVSEMDGNAGGVNVLPLGSIPVTVENVGPHSSTTNKDSGRRSDEKLNARCPKGTDIYDAVELSVAASEALVIHELVKSELDSEALPTAAVLEAALQMKEARLEGLQNTFHYLSEETDEIDSLSDLDDLTMVDAFEDVGLSFSGPDDQHVYNSDMSAVKGTPVSENIHNCSNEFNYAELLVQEHIDDPAPAMKTSTSGTHVDPMVHQPSKEILHVSSISHGVNFSMVGTSIRPPLHAWNLDDDGEDNLCYLVPDRFRSCGFRGWTVKENVDVPAQLQLNNAKSIMKPFVHETSFLSESAEVAPDENSFVQKHETGSKIASHHSVPFEGFCNKADEGISIFQEVGSFNLSLVDPLCSVVPCSISSENACSSLTPNQIRHGDAENCFGSMSELGMENLQRTSDLEVEAAHGDGQAVPTVTGKCAESLVERKLTSLKTYSTLIPKHNAIRYPDGGNSEGFLPFSPASECTVGRDNEENNNSTVVKNPIAETKNDKRDYDEPAKDGAELQVLPSKERRLPLLRNQKMCCSVKASKRLLRSSTREINLELPAAQENLVKLDQCKNLQKLQSECNNPCDPQVLVRKRVRFSGVEVELQQDKSIQKLQVSHKNRSTNGSNKKQKYSNAWLDSQTLDVKRCFATCKKHWKRFIFQGIEFLLTGFSREKEKEIEGLIRKYGGMVLWDIPSHSTSRGKRSSKSKSQQLPVVLCSKKLQTTEFLYGCAVNTFILKIKWLTDSIAAGSVVPPEKYMILSSQANVNCARIGRPVCCDNHKGIFERVGILLHGKHLFCTKLAIIVEHGGGRVFKSLQWLVQSLDSEKISVGTIVAEDENRASRHLRQCASERKIPMMPASWIVKSLHLGKLLPFKENKHSPLATAVVQDLPTSLEWSEEI